MNLQETKKSRVPLLGDNNNTLVLLFAINALVFVLLNGLKVVYLLSYDNNFQAEEFF